jgi:hypothetical protein
VREEDQIDMMHDSHALWQEIDRLRAELAQRTAERDEARRLYCHAQARIPDGRPEQLAQTLGWDCFKEANP